MATRLKEMLDRIENVQTENERKSLDDYCKTVTNEVRYQWMLEKMSYDEIYKHIQKQRELTRLYELIADERVEIAKNIIKGWVTLSEACDVDPNLAADWESFLVIMKMIE